VRAIAARTQLGLLDLQATLDRIATHAHTLTAATGRVEHHGTALSVIES
jgi:hypothetical protein